MGYLMDVGRYGLDTVNVYGVKVYLVKNINTNLPSNVWQDSTILDKGRIFKGYISIFQFTVGYNGLVVEFF